MSIWNKLGLADAAAMSSLQQELAAVRAENEQLHKAYAEKLESLVSSQNGEIGKKMNQLYQIGVSEAETAHREHDGFYKALTEFQEKNIENSLSLGSEIKHLNQQAAKILEYLEQMRPLWEETAHYTVKLESAIGCLEKQGQVMLQTMKETDQTLEMFREEMKMESGAISAAIASGQTETLQHVETLNSSINRLIELEGKTSESLRETMENLPEIREYLYHLWEAMKLVWVNDLIEDLK